MDSTHIVPLIDKLKAKGKSPVYSANKNRISAEASTSVGKISITTTGIKEEETEINVVVKLQSDDESPFFRVFGHTASKTADAAFVTEVMNAYASFDDDTRQGRSSQILLAWLNGPQAKAKAVQV